MNTAVVTGAGRGLGRCIAIELARREYRVLVTDIDDVAAAATARGIGERAWSMHQDVRDPASHHAVARAASVEGPLSVWVNNAGVLHAGTAWDIPDDDIRRHVDINVLGVMWGSRAALDAMRVGHIINIASMSALVPTPGLAVYGATKHAVLGFSVSLQGDLDRAGRDISVTAICPDAIDTDMVRNVAGEDSASILFSSRQLTPEIVARRVVEALDSRQLVVTIPRHRGLLTHLARPFPRLSLRVMERLERLGRRRRTSRRRSP